MVRRSPSRCVASALALSALVASAGCSASTAPGRVSAAGSTSATHPSTTHPSTTCRATTHAATFTGRVVITNLLSLALPPDSSRTNAVLQPVRELAVTPGGTVGEDLWAQVDAHYRTTVARPGARLGHDPLVWKGVVRNSTSHNGSYEILQRAEQYTGSFVTTCGGRRTTGAYRTFGSVGTQVLACGNLPSSALGRAVKPYCA